MTNSNLMCKQKKIWCAAVVSSFIAFSRKCSQRQTIALHDAK